MTTHVRTPPLPDDVDALKRIIAQLDEKVAALQHNVALLTKWAFGPKSERRPQGSVDESLHQGSLLFPEIIEAAERVADLTGATGEVELKTPDRTPGSAAASSGNGGKRAGRRNSFPEHLPVVRSTFELPEAERTCPCCGKPLHVIGEEISKELERVEFTIVHEIARKKYSCKSCATGVKTAPGPDRVIDRGLLGVGFLSHLVTERFQNHMPYHRLERKYESEGLDLSRSVLSESAMKVSKLLEPIFEQVKRNVLAPGMAQTDATNVLRLAPGVADRCEMWTYRAMDGEVFYDYADKNSRDGPWKVLERFKGHLQADADQRYRPLYRSGEIVEVGCWAHARRRFVDAEATEPELSKQAIDLIRVLYAIERTAIDAGMSPEQRRELRQKESVPQLARIRDWMTATKPKILERGPLGRAISYAEKKWEALQRYVEDGRLQIDNNGAERALRSVAVGRKNWTFLGNERGGKAAAILYTLVMSAKAAGIDPRMYIRDVLLRIGRCSDVKSLTPKGWKERWLPEVSAHRQSILEEMFARAAR